jgi:tetratricopeptide (TPR) repeat protein
VGNFFEELISAARDRWHARSGIALLLIALIPALLAFFAGTDFATISPLEWGLTGVIVAGTILFWWRTRVPRARKGSIGFGVAICYEDKVVAAQLRSDIVFSLRDLVTTSAAKYRVDFLEFPVQIAQRIAGPDDALLASRRSRLHFILYGRARARGSVGGSQKYVLDLHAYVRHRAIPGGASREFSKDFSAVLPHHLILDADPVALQCELAARHLDAVARYIIGTASAVSGDFGYAEQLLLEAEARLTQYIEDGATLEPLLGKVQNRIVDVYRGWLNQLSTNYRLKRQRSNLEECEPILQKLRERSPDDYSLHLMTAICAFMLRRDVAEATREIEECRKRRDGTWRYSEAFLYGYVGNLDAAYESYKRAFSAPLAETSVPTQTEEFIQIVIDEEPDKPWLYFCLGLLNRRAKGDIALARRDFVNFLEKVDRERFAKHVAIVERWVSELDTALGSRGSR